MLEEEEDGEEEEEEEVKEEEEEEVGELSKVEHNLVEHIIPIISYHITSQQCT